MWKQYLEDLGFAIIPGVFAAPELERLLHDLSAAKLPRGRAGIRHALRHPSVAALASDSRLLERAKEVLGDTAFPFRATLFDKSQIANWLVVWHQDRALPLRERKDLPGWGPWSEKQGIVYAQAPTDALCEVLAFRVHFDDSTSRNGPLRVLPGTHKLGVLSDEAVHGLSSKCVPTDCLVGSGGVLLMRPLVIHASSKSEIDTPRRVLHIEYAARQAFPGGLELAIA